MNCSGVIAVTGAYAESGGLFQQGQDIHQRIDHRVRVCLPDIHAVVVAVAHAYDGADAIEKYVQLNQKPDIILMDHRMPVMSGTEATTEIHKINPKAKIIFISADESVRDIAISAGALDFLTKPIRSKQLFAIMEKYSSA